MLLSCIFIFFIGALASSLAKTATQIIAFRALTGVGGGGLMTLAQTIVSDVVSLRDRSVPQYTPTKTSLTSHDLTVVNIRAYWYVMIMEASGLR